ncbi:hypothetical protein CC78DRAFT_582709 [Lojkania enalia]|uniref:Uncharacterized protein n=1 Tax=Lojkania enalia TaxID=147567 RepID=A0A9P4N7L9_9PLEO|nr:hypothetical protein CC78DRAFT_582709 [Didymosphaeria enalia]
MPTPSNPSNPPTKSPQSPANPPTRTSILPSNPWAVPPGLYILPNGTLIYLHGRSQFWAPSSTSRPALAPNGNLDAGRGQHAEPDEKKIA